MLHVLQLVANEESGATAIEYGLIAALISIAGVAAFTTMGGSLTSIFFYVHGWTSSAGS